MEAILRYLLAELLFLFEENRFRFVDSMVLPSFGGDAVVVIQSHVLRLRFITDRGQLFLDFQSTARDRERDWFSIDVIRTLLTDDRPESAELDAQYAVFLREHLDEIEGRFETEAIGETEQGLRALERERAKRLFG